jgi:hypothetical protein
MRTAYGLLSILQLCIGWTSEDKPNGESGTEDRWNGVRSQVQGKNIGQNTVFLEFIAKFLLALYDIFRYIQYAILLYIIKKGIFRVYRTVNLSPFMCKKLCKTV